MNKIKITSGLIIILFLCLAFVSNHLRVETKEHNQKIATINEQKGFTQEISKNIFYIYNNKELSIKDLDTAMKKFFKDMDKQENIKRTLSSIFEKRQKDRIITLWSKFYIEVQNFRNLNATKGNPYIKITLDKSIKNIYTTNQTLLDEFNELIFIYQLNFNDMIERYKIFQYILFTLLLLMSIYFFSQIKIIMEFVQKFLHTSKTIIVNSSIKELQKIDIKNSNGDIINATNNFNYFIENINNSILYAADSIALTTQSIEQVEQNIENFLDLMSQMDDTIDAKLIQKEDAIILSLEELMKINQALNELKKDLIQLVDIKN